jgi:Holliday junction resolvase RusA-like endonuclease
MQADTRWCDPITLPIPPSVNHIWRRKKGGGVFISKTYQEWLNTAHTWVRLQALPRFDPELVLAVNVTIRPGPPGNRGWKSNRDLDNCLKVLLDFMRKVKVIASDDCSTLPDIRVRLGRQAEKAHAQIRFKEITGLVPGRDGVSGRSGQKVEAIGLAGICPQCGWQDHP